MGKNERLGGGAGRGTLLASSSMHLAVGVHTHAYGALARAARLGGLGRLRLAAESGEHPKRTKRWNARRVSQKLSGPKPRTNDRIVATKISHSSAAVRCRCHSNLQLSLLHRLLLAQAAYLTSPCQSGYRRRREGSLCPSTPPTLTKCPCAFEAQAVLARLTNEVTPAASATMSLNSSRLRPLRRWTDNRAFRPRPSSLLLPRILSLRCAADHSLMCPSRAALFLLTSMKPKRNN